jgi:hypothetical protein
VGCWCIELSASPFHAAYGGQNRENPEVMERVLPTIANISSSYGGCKFCGRELQSARNLFPNHFLIKRVNFKITDLSAVPSLKFWTQEARTTRKKNNAFACIFNKSIFLNAVAIPGNIHAYCTKMSSEETEGRTRMRIQTGSKLHVSRKMPLHNSRYGQNGRKSYKKTSE